MTALLLSVDRTQIRMTGDLHGHGKCNYIDRRQEQVYIFFFKRSGRKKRTVSLLLYVIIDFLVL